jgi:alkanesulfonate monooxygenase SsuD/methylene tetrahydromethanopterin reductase-like flavin-dependent oxidoreductase (luciferase family)
MEATHRSPCVQDLKFGIFDHLDRGDKSIAELYEQRLRIIELYDRSGFHAYHLAEHHSTPLGMAPSPSVFLSSVAQRTTKLRFGPLVYLLPLYHPIRLSEEIAMLDQLSRGRLEVGVGRGRSPIELALYGREASEAQAVYEEALAVLKLGFTEDRVTFKGKHFAFDSVPVELRPWQKPHPPLWYGVGTPDSAAQLGKEGFNAVTLAKVAPAAEIVKRFYEAAQKAGHVDRRIGICRFVVVAETDADARKIADRAYPVWHKSFFELFHRYGQKPVSSWPATFAEMAANGLAYAGSARTITEVIGEQLRVTGANYVVNQLVFGDMTLQESQTSIGLFASEVMPALTREFRAARPAAE